MIQYMYMLAVDQSHKPEPLNMVSILHFHDAVELFLALASEHLNAGKTGKEFLAYWEAINQKLPSKDFGQKDSMSRLNAARVNWKHHGIRLPTIEIDDFKTNVSNFFYENTPKVFGLSFDAISMAALVQNEKIQDRLLKAEQVRGTNDIKAALKEIAIAFLDLLNQFEWRIREHHDLQLKGISSRHFSPIERKAPKELSQFAKEIEKEISSLHEQIKLVSLGIDYRKYTRFQWLMPAVFCTMDGIYHTAGEGRGQSHQDYLFCYHFVIECALRLQEIQFS